MTNKKLIEKLEYCADYNDLGPGMAELVRIAADRIKYLAQFVEWRPIEEAPDYTTILTIHEDDLFPVSASKIPNEHGADYWARETEGPEDEVKQGEPLLRTPTYWLSLPPKPEVE